MADSFVQTIQTLAWANRKLSFGVCSVLLSHPFFLIAPRQQSRFVWDGCRDYTAQLAAPAVLDFWTKANPDDVRRWMRSKLLDAVRIIAEKWHPTHAADIDSWSGTVTLGPIEYHAPMALVRLPDSVCGSTNDPKSSNDAKAVQDYLYGKAIEVPVKCINGILYVRLSCHIYNHLQEYDVLAGAMLEMP